MKTTINNNLRVLIVTSSLGDMYFCNIQELNKVVLENNLNAGYFSISSIESGKLKKLHKSSLKILFLGAKIEQQFIY